MKIGIILTPDVRSTAYIQKIIKNKIPMDSIILMSDNRHSAFSEQTIAQSLKSGFDISKSVKSVLDKNNLLYKEFPFVDINHPLLYNFLKESDVDFFIFTGGGILKDQILSINSKFIHLHPGLVPEYKGSTCFYYSIIDNDRSGVTAFIMNSGLDTGDIILQKIFPKPNHQYLDEIYDANIRSEVLIEILQNNLLDKIELRKQNPLDGTTYFIIHPVLKHIAILSCLK